MVGIIFFSFIWNKDIWILHWDFIEKPQNMFSMCLEENLPDVIKDEDDKT